MVRLQRASRYRGCSGDSIASTPPMTHVVDTGTVAGEPDLRARLARVAEDLAARMSGRWQFAAAVIGIRQACSLRLAAFKLPTKVILADREDLYSVRLKKKRQA